MPAMDGKAEGRDSKNGNHMLVLFKQGIKGLHVGKDLISEVRNQKTTDVLKEDGVAIGLQDLQLSRRHLAGSNEIVIALYTSSQQSKLPHELGSEGWLATCHPSCAPRVCKTLQLCLRPLLQPRLTQGEPG